MVSLSPPTWQLYSIKIISLSLSLSPLSSLSPGSCINLLISVRLDHLHSHQERAEFQFFIVRILQQHRAVASLDARYREDRLTYETRIAENVFVVDGKFQQGQVRVDDVKLT